MVKGGVGPSNPLAYLAFVLFRDMFALTGSANLLLCFPSVLAVSAGFPYLLAGFLRGMRPQ
jgi:hypothetical protein